MSTDSEQEDLISAILEGNNSKVTAILRKAPPEFVRRPTDEGGTMLLHVAAFGDYSIVQTLLTSGADQDVNLQNDDGLSPLHVAAMAGNVDTLRLLIKYGADRNVRTEEGQLPVDLATEGGHSCCITELRPPSSKPHAPPSVAPPLPPPKVAPPLPLPNVAPPLPLPNVAPPLPLPNVAPPLPLPKVAPPFPPPKVAPPLPAPNVAPRLSSDDSVLYTTAIDFSAMCLSTKPDPMTVPDNLLRLSNQDLGRKLVAMGTTPGPITSTTRPVYLKQLAKLLRNGAMATCEQSTSTSATPSSTKSYKYELAQIFNGTLPLPDLSSLEAEVFGSPLYTSGVKVHFNYFLLDPRCVDRLKDTLDGCAAFRVFVEAIFYVGKGANSRSLQHLRDARDHTHGKNVSRKLEMIHKIWGAGRGVMSISFFHNTTAGEAFTREACMIEAIGLHMLTNVVKGHAEAPVAKWATNKKRLFGIHLIRRALKVFMADVPREIFHNDL